MSTAVVTASIRREWHPGARASVEDWVSRCGHTLVHITDDDDGKHPYRQKFRWIASVEGYDRIIWIDDDVVIRKDAPDLPDHHWSCLNVYPLLPPRIRNTWKRRIRWEAADRIARQAGVLTPDKTYFNSGVFSTRDLLGIQTIYKWSQFRIAHGAPDEGALTAYVGNKGWYQLSHTFNWRWPDISSGKLPGYFNHFLMRSRRNLDKGAELWDVV